MTETITDRKLREFASVAIQEATANLARRGKPGAHCFFCGSDASLIICGCEFGTDFACAASGRYACSECHKAHMRIAKHLREMFSFPRAMRSNARRHRHYRELREAAKSLESPTGDPDDFEPSGTSQGLAFFLAQADEIDDQPDEFRRNILDAFRHAQRFSIQRSALRVIDFKALTAALAREKEKSLLRSLAHTLGSFRP